MTKLPSTLVIQERANGADTQFSQLSGGFVQMPLQKWLRATTTPGSYTQATEDKRHAFEPINTMCSDIIDDAHDSNSSDSSIDNIAEHKPTDTTPKDTGTNDLHAQLPRDTIEDQTPKTPTVDESTQWPVYPQPTIGTKIALNKLYRSICDSTDRVFIIIGFPHLKNNDPYNTTQPQPHEKCFSIAQVCWNATNPIQAKEAGIYKMQLWLQAPQDKGTRSLSQSRFYPALQSINQTNNKFYPTKPDKVQHVLANDPTLSWQFFDVPLAEVRIVGPLNFIQRRLGLKGPKKQAVSETHHIDEIYWQQNMVALSELTLTTTYGPSLTHKNDINKTNQHHSSDQYHHKSIKKSHRVIVNHYILFTTLFLLLSFDSIPTEGCLIVPWTDCYG